MSKPKTTIEVTPLVVRTTGKGQLDYLAGKTAGGDYCVFVADAYFCVYTEKEMEELYGFRPFKSKS